MRCVIFPVFKNSLKKTRKIFISEYRNVIKSILGLKLLSSSVIQQHELAVNTNNVVNVTTLACFLLLLSCRMMSKFVYTHEIEIFSLFSSNFFNKW